MFEDLNEDDVFVNTCILDEYYNPWYNPEKTFGEYILYTENEYSVAWMPIVHYIKRNLESFEYTCPKIYMKKLILE